MKLNFNIDLIEIVEDEPRISHRVIAKEIFDFDSTKKKSEELQLKNKMTQIKELINDNIDDLKEFGRVRFETESEFSVKEKQKSNPNYRAETTYFLNEAQATLLLTFMRNFPKIKIFKKRLVKEFFEIREILNSQTPQKPQTDQKVINNLFALERSFDLLRPSEASKIKMTEKLYTKLDLETCYLPKYTEENLTYSLTHLLKKYEVGISTQKANLRLLELGILKKLHRNSINGTVKYFWSFTEFGLRFGKNMTSPKNERETQPHFFEKEFLNLIKLF